ncbi:MAG TPA: amidohydrolase, partial [Anaerolineaceae bacterium]
GAMIGAAPTAIAIDHGRVVQTGSDADLLARFADAETQDMLGRTIWPGLTDAHIHLQHYAYALQMVNCETATRAETLRRVAERARQPRQGAGWVRGHGWNQNNWPEGYGSAAELDAVAPDVPVYLTAKSLHAGWINSAALRAVGITRNTPDPDGGRIGRDAQGEPNGLVFESAMDLVNAAIPAPSLDEVARALDSAQQTLWRVGVTSVHDYDGSTCFSALQQLQANGNLRLRVVKSIPLNDLEHAIAVGLRSGYGNDTLRIGPVKLFADGALGPRTAAMLQPYEGEPENTGILLLDNEQVFEYGQRASAHGISMTIHAIGDRANHEVLAGYAQLRRYESENGLPPLRHRIEHVQLLHPDDFQRLAELHLTASVQPIQATSDISMADRFWGKRGANAYRFKTLLDSGARVCFGSDAPVESPNPFLGLHAAVTRQRVDGAPGADGWYPDQRVSLEQSLHAFTTGPAYAVGWESQQGRLAPGYFADLIVLNEDPFDLPPHLLHQVHPSATMIGGEWVWKDE